MVGLGMLMFLVGLVSLYLRWRRTLHDTTWFHWFVAVMSPAGFLAIIAGWTTTETGRQPWTVQGLLRTADSISPVTQPEVATSFAVIVVIYLIVFGTGIGYLLRMMATAPDPGEAPPREDVTQHHVRDGLVSEALVAGEWQHGRSLRRPDPAGYLRRYHCLRIACLCYVRRF